LASSATSSGIDCESMASAKVRFDCESMASGGGDGGAKA